ncbi:MAG: ACT domain-containing protein [Clostridia bacterium]|nr:ACT domain-containing protein [Clostridia bacterium]
MYVRQISVFVENKKGKLAEITKLLSDAGVNLRALSIADTQDFGILRLIAADPTAVAMRLSQEGYICNVTEVLAVSLEDRPGSVNRVLTVLSDSGVNVEYAYAFVSSRPGYAHLVLRVSDNDLAVCVLKGTGITLLSQEEISQM